MTNPITGKKAVIQPTSAPKEKSSRLKWIVIIMLGIAAVAAWFLIGWIFAASLVILATSVLSFFSGSDTSETSDATKSPSPAFIERIKTKNVYICPECESESDTLEEAAECCGEE